MKFECHPIIENTNQKAAEVLAAETDLTKGAIKQAMTKGAVWLTRNSSTQRIRRADKTLNKGDQLHLYYDPEVLATEPAPATLIADEGCYSIWNKPYGMLCQGSKWGDHCTINRWAEKNLEPQRPAFIVHRLDRAATGLIILAHQKKTATYFTNLFQQRRIEKKYQAMVWGEFPEQLSLTSEIDNKPARSHCRLVTFHKNTGQSLVEVAIETGRKHQIRKHLSEAGFPIVGDRLYGRRSEVTDNDLCLTSCYLSFISPVDQTLKSYCLPVEH